MNLLDLAVILAITSAWSLLLAPSGPCECAKFPEIIKDESGALFYNIPLPVDEVLENGQFSQVIKNFTVRVPGT